MNTTALVPTSVIDKILRYEVGDDLEKFAAFLDPNERLSQEANRALYILNALKELFVAHKQSSLTQEGLSQFKAIPLSVPQVITPKKIEIRTKFTEGCIAHMQRMNRESLEGLVQCRELPSSATQKEINAIIGCRAFYPHDMYEVLLKFPNVKDWLKNLIGNGATYHGYANPNFFESVKATHMPTKRLLFTHRAKEWIAPSAALEQLQNSLFVTDCATMVSYCICVSLHDLIGSPKFNRLLPFSVSGDKSQTPAFNLLFSEVQLRSEKELEVGDVCFFSNIPDCLINDPLTNFNGLNAFYMGNGYFVAFGLKGKLTAEEIEKILWEACNAKPTPKELVRADIQAWRAKHAPMIAAPKGKISWENFKKAKSSCAIKGEPSVGKMLLSVMRPDLESIESVAQASEENVVDVYRAIAAKREKESREQQAKTKALAERMVRTIDPAVLLQFCSQQH